MVSLRVLAPAAARACESPAEADGFISDGDGGGTSPDVHLAGDEPDDPEEQLRARCVQAGVVYLAPGAHPQDSSRREVTSAQEKTRREWQKKRRRLLCAHIERAQSKAPSFSPPAPPRPVALHPVARMLPLDLVAPWYPCTPA